MNKLAPIEFNGQRILTTAQLAELYDTNAQTITNNYNRNKERYHEGRHYFAIEGDEKSSFINLTQIDLGSKNAKTLYLWTERGALLHAKSLGTDRAWKIYGELVDTYFGVTEQRKPLSAIEMMKLQNQAIFELDERTAAVESKLITVADKVDNFYFSYSSCALFRQHNLKTV